MQERYSNYKIVITLPNGIVISQKVFATTLWHAIDKLFTKFSDEQPDRTQYKKH
mgnify:CR=1 FL=1